MLSVDVVVIVQGSSQRTCYFYKLNQTGVFICELSAYHWSIWRHDRSHNTSAISKTLKLLKNFTRSCCLNFDKYVESNEQNYIEDGLYVEMLR